MSKGIIYYTNNNLVEPIYSTVQKQILWATEIPISSASLRPINFGSNVVVDESPGILAIYKQILAALENSKEDYVFFCEHDVLYHPSHFEFTPPRDDTYYYNVNVWRWEYPRNRVITYDHIISLSGLCANRELAIQHYKLRLKTVYDRGWDKVPEKREPTWCRKIGHEPGTKKRRSGGLTNESHDLWKSEYPNIDIRHNQTLSRPKCYLEEFKHPPREGTWRETTLDKIEGWTDIVDKFKVKEMTPLCELAFKYRSDKCPFVGTLPHSYTPFYYELLKDKRESIKKVVELGTGTPDTMILDKYITGAGLRMWRDFFPNAMVYGADIKPESVFTDDRIETFQYDLSKKENLLELISKTGTDVDLFIDDASHKRDDQILAALTLMPLFKKDVIYIIEDIKFLQPIRWALRPYYNIYEPRFPNPTSRGDRLIVVSHK